MIPTTPALAWIAQAPAEVLVAYRAAARARTRRHMTSGGGAFLPSASASGAACRRMPRTTSLVGTAPGAPASASGGFFGGRGE
jgi:hypothetical protein